MTFGEEDLFDMWFRLKNDFEWSEWDNFVKNEEGSSFLSLSTWLDTYCTNLLVKKVGFFFKNEFGVQAGIAGVKVGIGLFSFIVFPSGPIIASKLVGIDISQLESDMSREIGSIKCIGIQLSSEYDFLLSIRGMKKKKRFKLIHLNSGQFLVPVFKDIESQMSFFKAKVRRDINSSLRKGLEFKLVTTTNELSIVYSLLSQNAINAGYRIRKYKSYYNSWVKGLKNDQFIFILAIKDNEPKGVIWLINCGKKFHYVMGGTIKEKPDLNTGYFLQYQAIMQSIKYGYNTYNISVGGSAGVKKFKEDFSPVLHNYSKPYFLSRMLK